MYSSMQTKPLPLNALIVTNHSVPYMDMFNLYELSETPFGVIHLSDEWFSDDVSFYDFSMCKFAWRNYYDERFDIYPKLNYLALSYKLGFWNGYDGKSPRDITYADREYAWSFAGAPRTNERMATLQMFKDAVLPNKVHFEMGNSFCKPETGLDTNAYRALLLTTQFGLCAVGISKTLSGDNIAQMGQVIFEHMIKSASGEATKSELHGYGQSEFVPWQLGAVM